MAEEKTNRQTDTGAGKTAGGKFDFVLAEDHATELLPALDAEPMQEPSITEKAIELLRDLRKRMHGNEAAIYATLSNWAAADAEGGNDESDKHKATLLARDVMGSTILRGYLQQRGFYEDTAGNYPEWKKAPADSPAELEQAAALFEECAQMTDKQRAAYINTGCFNSYIAAYMCLVLQEMGTDAAQITEARQTLRRVLDTFRAEDAKAATGEQ